MGEGLVLGLVPGARDAESLVNNLAEEDFPARAISVVTRNPEDAEAIGAERGPLRDVAADQLADRLIALGASSAIATSIGTAVLGGQALVAVQAPEALRSAALDTLRSAASQVHEL
jgi:hypothetical protein